MGVGHTTEGVKVKVKDLQQEVRAHLAFYIFCQELGLLVLVVLVAILTYSSLVCFFLLTQLNLYLIPPFTDPLPTPCQAHLVNFNLPGVLRRKRITNCTW